MRDTKLIIFLVLVMFLFASCSGASKTTAPLEPEVTEDVLPTETEDEEIQSPTIEPTKPEPTPTEVEPTVEPTSMEVPTGECLDCHMDKDRLIDTAKPEEEVVNESSGEG